MGVFVFLPLVLPLTALPIVRVAEQHLHPRSATRLLTALGCVLALCSTVCLILLMVVGTAQLPGNPLPDGWADPEVRAVVPYAEVTGTTAIVALAAVVIASTATLHRHRRVRARAHEALMGLPDGAGSELADAGSDLAVLPDPEPYAYALPGTSRTPGRIVASTGMLSALSDREREALVAHERAHLTARHHRYLLVTRLVGCANPLLRQLHGAVAYNAERWADEDAAQAVGDRKVTARAVARAALLAPARPPAGIAAFAAAGPVPRRVAALLGPVPPSRGWPPAASPAGLAAFIAAAGTTVSAASSLNAALALFLVLKAATPL